MMNYAEKLSFLMHISGATNKELAQELSLDPSMISLMRSGKRKLPRNPDQVRKMAVYFARRCSAPFQRHALSETMNLRSISVSMPIETLSTYVESWLQSENMVLAGSFLSGITGFADSEPQLPEFFPAQVSVAEGDAHTRFFFGTEGRKEAIVQLAQVCRDIQSPATILTAVEDNMDWLMSDYTQSRKAQSFLLDLLKRGFTIQQIIPPLTYLNRYAESLQFWMPLYATGKISAYFYPRLRGNLYRHSIIVVPGHCVQYGFSIGRAGTSEISMFSRNPTMVESFEKMFREYTSQCRPALIPHENIESAIPCFRSFFGCQGSTMQLLQALSARSMPRELLERYMQESGSPIARDFFRVYLESVSTFEKQLDQELFIDMCRLATPEEVLAGAVAPVAYGNRSFKQPAYTAETYCLHLKNILRLMDEHDNYHFLPVSKPEYTDYDLLVKDDCIAMTARTTEPFMILEVRREPLVMAFREHLIQYAENAGYSSIRKRTVRLELLSLIQKLEEAAGQSGTQHS